MIKAALYAAVGMLLLAANLWFVRSLYDAYGRGATINRIAPFQILGKQDADGQLANALPIMLHARLRRIVRESEEAFAALGGPTAAGAAAGAGSGPEPRRAAEPDPEVAFATIGIADRGLLFQTPKETIAVPLPDLRRVQAPDVSLKLGPVEAKGFVPWVGRLFNQDRALEISVAYAGDAAFVYGSATGGADLSIYLAPDDFRGAAAAEAEAAASDDEIVAMIAYAILQHEYRRSSPAFGAFTPRGFRNLLTTIGGVAALNRRVAQGTPPAAAEYRTLLPDLLRLLEAAPTWQPLLHLAAGVAENAEDFEAAARLYEAELDLVGEWDRGRREALAAKVARLSQRAPAAADAAAAAAAAAARVSAEPAAVGDAAVERIRALLGVESPAAVSPAAGPRIAVLGGVPTRGLLPDDRVTVIGEWANTDAASTPYFDSLVRAVRLIAPDAQFLFRGNTVWTSAGLLEALQHLAAADPDILLVTLGPLEGRLFAEAFKALVVDQSIVAVLAAGNRPGQPVPFAGTPLLDEVMVVSAVTLEGQPAAFSQTDDKAFWAPGERVPVYVAPGTDEPQPQSGTTYAAALAAGIAARVLAERPALEPAELLAVLRSTSRPVAGSAGAPPILNLRGALERLARDGGQG